MESISSSELSPTLNKMVTIIGDEKPVRLQIDGPLLLSFSNLTYNVMVRPELNFRSILSGRGTGFFSPRTKTLLNDISGEARDGEVMAVMGASGSGKSTLIDALANRIARGSLNGSLTLNGERLDSRLLKAISAHVMQDDLLHPMLTVEETLLFAADFRLPYALPVSAKRARVQQLLDQLGLRDAAHTFIGDEGHRGISGGERRRVSIGIDIVHDPVLLFLDEPTSGLDSTSAYQVVKVLQRIAHSGSVVIMSVHQPSWRILGLLDRLIFLSHGQAVFSGPPSDLRPFFSGFGSHIPENGSPTEFALDLITDLDTSPGGTHALVDFNRQWQQARCCNKHVQGSPLTLSNKLISRTGSFANPMWKEILIVSRRAVTNSGRMPEQFSVRMLAILITGFILATAYWKLDDSPRGIQERLCFFGFSMCFIYFTCTVALPVFIQDRYIFLRETAHNAYRRSSYVLSHALTSFPGLVLLSLTFSGATFSAVGLSGGASGFLFYFLIILASFFAGNSLVSFVSAMVSELIIGCTIVIATLSYYFLFSGFFINKDQIPGYWIWLHYISMIKYTYEGVLMNEFQDSSKCFARGIQMFDKTPVVEGLLDGLKEQMLESVSESLGVLINSTTCLTRGEDVLAQLGVTKLSKWSCVLITLSWGFFFEFMFYLALLIGSKNKRK